MLGGKHHVRHSDWGEYNVEMSSITKDLDTL